VASWLKAECQSVASVGCDVARLFLDLRVSALPHFPQPLPLARSATRISCRCPSGQRHVGKEFVLAVTLSDVTYRRHCGDNRLSAIGYRLSAIEWGWMVLRSLLPGVRIRPRQSGRALLDELWASDPER